MDLESIRSLPCAILYMYDGVLGLFHPIWLKRFTGASRAEDNIGLAVTCKGSGILCGNDLFLSIAQLHAEVQAVIRGYNRSDLR
jgi:hypothetical protein